MYITTVLQPNLDQQQKPHENNLYLGSRNYGYKENQLKLFFVH